MLIESLLSLLTPYECLGCGREGNLLCPACQADCQRLQPRCYKCHAPSAANRTCQTCRPTSPLVSVYAAAAYQGLAKSLIWKLKFARAGGAAREIADLMAERIPFATPVDGARVIITHAPTAHRRVRKRGYDQAELLARQLSRHWHLPYKRLLVRRGTQEQVGADKARRTIQLANAFHALSTARLRGAHIILVDDVITTGATLEAAARVLRAAGAQQVDAVVYAQAELRTDRL